MNEKEKYINQKISNGLNNLYENQDKFKKEELISFVAFITFAVVCGTSIIFLPNVGLAAGAITGAIICHKYKNGKKNDSRVRRLNQEVKHLKNLKEKSTMTEEIKDKKITKLLAISKKRKNVENKYDNANILTGLSNAITVIGAGATFVNPLSFWLPLLGLCSNVLLSNYEINKYRAKELLENRMNNLISDLDVDQIEEEEKRKKTKVKENQRSVEISNNYVNEKEKQKVYIKNRG